MVVSTQQASIPVAMAAFFILGYSLLIAADFLAGIIGVLLLLIVFYLRSAVIELRQYRTALTEEANTTPGGADD